MRYNREGRKNHAALVAALLSQCMIEGEEARPADAPTPSGMAGAESRMVDAREAKRKEQKSKPVGTAAKKAAKRPSKVVVTKKPKAKTAKKARKASGGVGTGLVNKQQRPGYVKQYRKDPKVKTAGGHASVDCNDKVAAKLRGKTLKDAYEIVAREAKTSVPALKGKYGHLNPGMQRMNLGNVLRGAL